MGVPGVCGFYPLCLCAEWLRFYLRLWTLRSHSVRLIRVCLLVLLVLLSSCFPFFYYVLYRLSCVPSSFVSDQSSSHVLYG